MTINKNLLSLLIVILTISTGVESQTNATFGLFHTRNSSQYVQSVKFSPDGKYLAYNAAGDGLVILNGTTFSFINSTTTDFGGKSALAMAYSKDQQKLYYHIFTSMSYGTRPVSSPNNLLTLDTTILSSNLQYVRDLDINNDGTRLIRCGDTVFHIINITNNSLILNQTAAGYPVFSCKFRADNGYAISSAERIRVYNAANVLIASYNGNNDIKSIDWNSNFTLLAFV